MTSDDRPDFVMVDLALEESGHLTHFVIEQLLRLRRHRPGNTMFDTTEIRDHLIEVYTNLYAKLADANDLMMGKKS